MELPKLERIVETHVPISTPNDVAGYLRQLRKDVLPYIRKMQADRSLRWFSFLVHPKSQIQACERTDKSLVIHLRLEPAIEIDVQQFINLLPKHFRSPKLVENPPLSEMTGVERSMLRDEEWAHGWKILGDASEWVLCLLEGHKSEPSPKQMVRFLHYITNALMLGNRCLYLPGGFLAF